MGKIESRRFQIMTVRHETTGLLMAVSPDMPGLMVHAHSHEELEKKIPGRIRDLLVADGYEVLSLEVGPDEDNALPEFGPPAFIAQASLAATA
jgi:hypothetical protein